MTTPGTLIMYSRADCHLCEEAAAILDREGVAWRPVDIDGDPALIRQYDLSVPVLRRPDDGRELCYPFDARRLRRFIAGV